MQKTLLVIPHYNDSERFRPFLKELLETLPCRFTILVSDDGSEVNDQKQLKTLIQEFKSQNISFQCELSEPIFTFTNTGKGGAVYRGWDKAEGCSCLVFADADGAVSAGEILRAESYFRSQECTADALFASRVKMLGRSIERSLLRHLSGRVFATLVSEIGEVPAYDTQCGLKILRTESYKKIRPYLQSTGFAFDVELLLVLKKFACQVIEFPVDWHDVPGSKVSLIRDAVRMATEVLKIKKRVQSLSLHT